ncbi:MAG TPA: YfiR family protein [Pseudoduganella sp.]
MEPGKLTRRQWLAAALATGIAPAQAGGELERQVKAAFLYRFGGFVEWPESAFVRADSPLVIGLHEADELAMPLERTVTGRTVNGRALQVVKLRKADTTGGGRTPHIAFTGAQDRAAAQGLLDGCRERPILTVSDSEHVHGMGSVINFLLADERVRFEVSLKAAEAARLRISARLLSAAWRMRQGAAA